jgi:hypothetical protein
VCHNRASEETLMLPLISCVFLAHVAIAPNAAAALGAPVRPLSMEERQLALMQRTAADSAAMMRQRVGPVCSLRIIDAAPGLDQRMVMRAGNETDPGIARRPSCRPEQPARR